MAKTDFLAPADLRIVGSRLRIAGEAQFSLAAMGTTKIPDGALVYVQSVKAYFQLDKGSPATPDGSTIVNAALGPGNWYRLASNFAGASPWLDQADWYIDADNGDDENDGATAATALASHAELERRMGEGFVITQPTTVNILSDLDETIRLRGSVEGAPNVLLRYVGAAKNVLHTGVVNFYQESDYNVVPSSAEGQLTDATVADWTNVGGNDLRGKRVHFLNDDSYTFISKIALPGVGVARVGRPFRFNGAPTSIPYSPGATPSNGDPYQVEEFYQVHRGCDLLVTRSKAIASGLNAAGTVLIEGLEFGTSGGATAMVFLGPSPHDGQRCGAYVAFCSVHPSQIIGSGTGGCRFVSCTINTQSGNTASVTVSGGAFSWFAQAGGGIALEGCAIEWFANGSYFEGSVVLNANCTVDKSLRFGVFDATGAQAVLLNGSTGPIQIAALWGTPTADYGLRIEGYVYRGTTDFALGGTLNDILLGANALAYAALPYKNVPPPAGTDADDYHFLDN